MKEVTLKLKVKFVFTVSGILRRYFMSTAIDWDTESNTQIERDCTPSEELTLLDARTNISSRKQQAIATILQIAESKLANITSRYPAGEVSTFSKQLAEAVGYTADNNFPTPMLSAIASARATTVASIVARVILNSNNYSAYCGIIIGHRQTLEKLITAATTVQEVNAVDIINWPL